MQAADLEFITKALNQEPFALGLRLVDFGEKRGEDLLRLLSLVLNSIEPPGKAGCSPSGWQDSEALLQALQAIGYGGVPPDLPGREDWIDGVLQGDRATVHPVLRFCLADLGGHRRRAYLHQYLCPLVLPPDEPPNAALDDVGRLRIDALAERYRGLQEEFRAVHEQHEGLHRETEQVAELERDIAHSRREARQLREQIDVLSSQTKRDPEAFQAMLEVTVEMRKLKDESLRFEQRRQEVIDVGIKASEHLEQTKERATILQGQLASDSSIEDILHETNRDLEDLAIAVRSDQLMDVEILKQQLEDLEGQPPSSNKDLLSLQELVTRLDEECISKEMELEARRRAQASKDDISFQEADAATTMLETKKAELHEKREDVERLLSVVAKLDRMANEAARKWRSECSISASATDTHQSKGLEDGVRDMIKNHCDAQARLHDLRSEVAELRKTQQTIKDQTCRVDASIRDREDSQGVGGFRETQRGLEANAEAAGILDAEKGETLKNISELVARIAENVNAKKAVLQPQMQILKARREKFRSMVQLRNEKKGRFQRLSGRLAEGRRDLEQETFQLQDEWIELDGAFHELRISSESASKDLGELLDFENTSTYYREKILELKDREMQLKDEKRRVFEAEKSDTSINQRELFLNLEMLLRMKQGASSSESKEVIIAGNSTRMKIPEITV